MVKTVTLCKLNFILFHEKFRKQKTEVSTNFVLLSQPGNLIG